MHYVATDAALREQAAQARRELADAAKQAREAERQQWAKKGGVQLTAAEAFDVDTEVVIMGPNAANVVRRRRGDEPFDGTALEASSGPGAHVWIKFQRRREMQG